MKLNPQHRCQSNNTKLSECFTGSMLTGGKLKIRDKGKRATRPERPRGRGPEVEDAHKVRDSEVISKKPKKKDAILHGCKMIACHSRARSNFSALAPSQ